MKIRMRHSFSGPGICLAKNDETEQFDDKEAQRFIDSGFAEKVEVVSTPVTVATTTRR